MPDIRIKKTGKYCHLIRTNVDIKEKIFLPKWQQRKATKDPALAFVWDTLSQDIKRHEESHIIIARSCAIEIELALKRLPSNKSCKTLTANIAKTVNKLMVAYDYEQAQFDTIEGINYHNRIARLLEYRLEQTLNK